MKFRFFYPTFLNHPFTYESDQALETGDYVLVPFGKSKITGVVWDDFEKKNNKNFKIKKIIKKLEVPRLKKVLLNF
jgi:primosomal protein N' (replication factor Y)